MTTSDHGRHRRHGGQRTSSPFVYVAAVWILERALLLGAMLCLAGVVFGFGFAPFDRADQVRAEVLLSRGAMVSVSDVQVDLGLYGRSGETWEVDGVRVRIPGTADGDWVELTGLTAPELGPALDPEENWDEGWQVSTPATGYAAPLKIRYRIDSDGQVDAMTVQDITYWAGSDEWQFSALVGAVCLTILVAGLGLWRVATGRWPHLSDLTDHW